MNVCERVCVCVCMCIVIDLGNAPFEQTATTQSVCGTGHAGSKAVSHPFLSSQLLFHLMDAMVTVSNVPRHREKGETDNVSCVYCLRAWVYGCWKTQDIETDRDAWKMNPFRHDRRRLEPCHHGSS